MIQIKQTNKKKNLKFGKFLVCSFDSMNVFFRDLGNCELISKVEMIVQPKRHI